MFLTLYLLALGALVLNAPAQLWTADSRDFVILLGLLGVWRWGWQIVQLVRALVYRWLVFPRWRAQAEELSEMGPLAPAFFCLTCYRIPPQTVALALRAAIQDATAYGGEVTLVVATAERADQRLAKRVFQMLRPPQRVRLVLVRRPALGKRDALAASLAAVRRRLGDEPSFVVALDGDAIVPAGMLARCLPLFRLMPEVGVLTTDQDCVVEGGPLWREWLLLRFARRDLYACALGPSRRLLCPTGRMSIYRAEIATDPAFVARIEDDAIEHWRLGRIPLLTGEDKSAWLQLLERGRPAMLYVPDVRVATVEHPPERSFAAGSTRLMVRWAGNMLRANGPARRLGPGRIGAYLWWSVLDQRVSPWATLVAPLVTVLAVLAGGFVYAYAFLVWVATTRLVQALVLGALRGRVSGLWPLLLYWTQLWGALVKIYAQFHPDRQGWTRQGIRARAALLGWRLGLRALGSHSVQVLAFGYFVLTVAWLSRRAGLPVPSW
jgi:glycosyltransferase Alg8